MGLIAESHNSGATRVIRGGFDYVGIFVQSSGDITVTYNSDTFNVRSGVPWTLPPARGLVYDGTLVVNCGTETVDITVVRNSQ